MLSSSEHAYFDHAVMYHKERIHIKMPNQAQTGLRKVEVIGDTESAP